MFHHIEEQLSNIHQILGTLKISSTSPDDSTRSLPITHPEIRTEKIVNRVPLDSVTADISKDSPVFEGESSLSSQSHYATRFFEKAAVGSPHMESITGITGALSSLQNVLSRDHPQSAFHETQFPSHVSPKEAWHSAELPAMPDVVALLRWAKGR